MLSRKVVVNRQDSKSVYTGVFQDLLGAMEREKDLISVIVEASQEHHVSLAKSKRRRQGAKPSPCVYGNFQSGDDGDVIDELIAFIAQKCVGGVLLIVEVDDKSNKETVGFWGLREDIGVLLQRPRCSA